MTLTTSLITGRLPWPDDSTPRGTVRFDLSSFDSEGADIVLPDPLTFTLVNGALPSGCDLWRNTEGLRGTYYDVIASVYGVDGYAVEYNLGRIQVGASASYVLADLLEASGSITPGNNYTVLTDAELEAITVPHYDDQADFIAANLPAPVNTALVMGQPVIADEDGPITAANLRKWSQPGRVLDITMAGSASDLSNDFAGIFEQAATDAAEKNLLLRIVPKQDDTPFEYEYIDHLLAGDRLNIHFDGRTILKPRTNFQHFVAGAGTGPFVITDFPWNPTDWNALSLGWFRADGSEGTITSGYTILGSGSGPYSIMLDAPAGDPADILVAAGQKNALTLRGVHDDGKSVFSSGHMNIDIGRFGYVLNKGSGSGLATVNLDHFYHSGLIEVYSSTASGWDAASVDKRGDTGVGPLNYKSFVVDGTIRATGMNDLACYFSGGADFPGHDDDSRGLSVRRIEAIRCGAAAKLVRQHQSAQIDEIYAYETKIGLVAGFTGSNPMGSSHYFGSIVGERIGQRLIDLGDMQDGGSYIGYASVRDIGFKPDGVTAVAASACLRLIAVKGIKIGHIDFRQRDWTGGSAGAISLNGTTNNGIRVESGHIDGFATGLTESGGTAGEAGNFFRFNIYNPTTAVSLESGSTTELDVTVLDDAGGGEWTTTRIRKVDPQEQTFTPQLRSGGTAITLTGTDFAEGAVTQSGENVIVRFRMQVKVTNFTGSGGALRVHGFPTAAGEFVGTSLAAGHGTVVMAGLTFPAGSTQIVASIPELGSYVQFSAMGSGIGSALMTDLALPQADAVQRTITISGQLIYRVAT